MTLFINQKWFAVERPHDESCYLEAGDPRKGPHRAFNFPGDIGEAKELAKALNNYQELLNEEGYG